LIPYTKAVCSPCNWNGFFCGGTKSTCMV